MAKISIDRRYWVEDAVARAWPPGQDVFTGENNPKANYALDLNIDGEVMTFIPESVINNGVYNPFSDTRVSGKSYYMPWFLNQQNQQTLAEVGKKVDLANSDVGGYLKDKMGASTSGVLVPKGSIPFDSQVVNSPGKVLGMGSISGQPVYLTEDYTNSGRTFFTDAAGQTREYIPPSGGGWFDDMFGGIADIGESVIGGIKDFGKSVDQTVRDTVPGGWTTAALLAAGAYNNPELFAAESAAPAAATELAGYDAAMADLAASTPAFTGAEASAAAAAAGNADKAALYGNEGYGAGMTGAETAAYDTGLAAGAGAAEAGATSMADKLPGALGLAAGATALGSMLIPDIPSMGSPYEAKKTEPDWSIKFDDPVKQMQVPDSFDFQLDTTPSPYLTMSQTGPIVGDMLFDPTQAYSSNLVKGLRANSNAPASVNPGFTLYQSAKP